MSVMGLLLIGMPVMLVVWGVMLYNRLVGQRNQVKNAWKQIDVQLKRRHDLIPNLVEVVRTFRRFDR